MYHVIYIHSGLTAIRFLNRNDAMHWAAANSFDAAGEPLVLFKIKRITANQG